MMNTKKRVPFFAIVVSLILPNISMVATAPTMPRSVFDVGITRYLKDVYNHPEYSKDFLPNNFYHMMELLDHGRQTGQNTTYYKSVLRLFVNKPMSYVNAYAFSDLLDRLPALLEDKMVVSKTKQLDSLGDIINELLYSSFISNFPAFKSNPGTFIDTVTQNIEDAVEMRKLLMLFLHNSMSKLIWSPEDQHQTWYTVKAIGDRLTGLYNKTMISDQDDLNTLFVTLIDRYCYFLDLSSDRLLPSCFEKIKEDILSHSNTILDLEEQEDLVQTKSERLMNTLVRCHAESLARDADLVMRPYQPMQ